ncbi:hypothetical protein LSTR_LSTR012389 [Laodelphax striatellus]|uniref:Ig-like domain-containing protein n=1 Tax=Laodelphax striatellus TaxID=195883 RepID=A0A482WUS0_LAOST|nr:hypothetical protein LSTR_LSTR012389 [Laodelphax striatellus]
MKAMRPNKEYYGCLFKLLTSSLVIVLLPGRTCQQDAEINNSVGDVSAVPSAELSPLRGPYFDTSASKNVTALVGKTAYLNCRVRNLGNRTVWSGLSFTTANHLTDGAIVVVATRNNDTNNCESARATETTIKLSWGFLEHHLPLLAYI